MIRDSHAQFDTLKRVNHAKNTPTKTCTKCETARPLTQFYKRPTGGFHPHCKACWPKYKGIGRTGPRPKPIPSKIEGNRICIECDRDLPIEEFYYESRRSEGFRCRCETCHKLYIKVVPYGITVREYREAESRQKNACAICKRKMALVIDHCHESGEFRGLLCHRCNIGLAILDDEERSHAAADYLGWEHND